MLRMRRRRKRVRPAGMNPLIVNVIVRADDVEVLGISAQMCFAPTGNHVPRFKLRAALALGGGFLLRFFGVGRHMNYRGAMHKARVRRDLPDRDHGCDGGANHLLFHFFAALIEKRIKIRDFPSSPRKNEISLIGQMIGAAGFSVWSTPAAARGSRRSE